MESAKRERLGKARVIDSFVRDIEIAVTEFDERLWVAVVDRVTVGRGGVMVFSGSGMGRRPDDDSQNYDKVRISQITGYMV